MILYFISKVIAALLLKASKYKKTSYFNVQVESGWGSMLPTVVLAHMNPAGPAAHCSKQNIGDQIISINGISLVGLPLSTAQTHIKNTKSATAVRLTVVSTPPVVEVRIRFDRRAKFLKEKNILGGQIRSIN